MQEMTRFVCCMFGDIADGRFNRNRINAGKYGVQAGAEEIDVFVARLF